MHVCVLTLLVLCVAVSSGQRLTAIRPGACPPVSTIQICSETCRRDGECPGQEKCCITSCYGKVCVAPVSPSRAGTPRSGSCPANPTGRWVCSSTCRNDSDCRSGRKCCRGRCPGSMLCQKPEL